MKNCTVCKELLPLTSYHNSSKTRDGKGYRCIKCDRLARKKYREDNYERFLELHRNQDLLVKYGLSLEDYENIRRVQDDCCKICGKHVSKNNGPVAKNGSQRLCVDHCHSTGKVRGLLCNNCNRALGLLKDDKEILKKMIEYLDVH